MHIFERGELVYYDSMRGLVKGKIIKIELDLRLRYIPDNPPTKYTIKVTSKNHPIYKLGEFIESSKLWIIPRDKVYIKSCQYRIKPY
jgi:hypothetical protein